MQLDTFKVHPVVCEKVCVSNNQVVRHSVGTKSFRCAAVPSISSLDLCAFARLVLSWCDFHHFVSANEGQSFVKLFKNRFDLALVKSVLCFFCTLFVFLAIKFEKCANVQRYLSFIFCVVT